MRSLILFAASFVANPPLYRHHSYGEIYLGILQAVTKSNGTLLKIPVSLRKKKSLSILISSSLIGSIPHLKPSTAGTFHPV